MGAAASGFEPAAVVLEGISICASAGSYYVQPTPTKRRAVRLVIETGLGTTAEACRALGLGRSSYYRNSAVSAERRKLQQQIVELSQEHPRYG